MYYDLMYGQYKETYPKWEGFKRIADHSIFLSDIVKKINQKNINLPLDYFISPEDIINNYPTVNNIKIIAYYFSFPITKSFVNSIVDKIRDKTSEDVKNIGKSIQNLNNKISYGNNFLFQLINKYNFVYQHRDSFSGQINTLNSLVNYQKDFINYKSKFMKDFNHYVNIANALGKILPIILLSFLLTFVVGLCALLILSFCDVSGPFWTIVMHIAWNGLRFFIFVFFIYGSLYGMIFLLSRDAIAFLGYAFSKDNVDSDNTAILPKQTGAFFKTCLYSNPFYDDFKNNNILNEFLKNYFNFRNWFNNITEKDCFSDNENVRESCRSLIYELYNNYSLNFKNVFEPDDKSIYINYFESIFERNGNIYDNMNCSFIYNNINLMYRALWDFAWESRILCGLSCCIAFFGEIAVLSFLYTRYNYRIDGQVRKKRTNHLLIKGPNPNH